MFPPDEMLASPTGFLLELELAGADRSDKDRNLIAASFSFDHIKRRLQFAGPHQRRHLFAEALAIKRNVLRHPARQY
jgi:hypothetical protein